MHAEVDLIVRPEESGRPSLYTIAKRVLDIILSFLALMVLAPVFALCTLAILLDSPGPILFRQQRVGKRGKVFTMLKFRSMYANAESGVHRDYYAAFIRGQADRRAAGGDGVYKLAGDSRVTRVGRWLRRTSLDELPQLWNTLRGDMSLVGPRPPIPYEVEHYRPVHLGRLAVKPGITGLWQVGGRSSTTFDEMVALDLQYIQKASFSLDLQILLKTVPAVLRTREAH
jgi:exopolysaccharide biosynthesis polyprenyl glycosylphosphotransferase